MIMFIYKTSFVHNKEIQPFEMENYIPGSLSVLEYPLSKNRNCLGGVLNITNICVDIMLVPETFLSISTMEFSEVSSFERKSQTGCYLGGPCNPLPSFWVLLPILEMKACLGI
eukprot:TRINITY_DN1948_c0_g2_i21.p1 TRINITY_DN1948_c0_g2~~TRINITY_DN1948_c0_g2_i21.p1  ORF type:complete len:113 (-),score=9.21 TRINITY_DN1948_c0_g2_i21:133-471(-)